MSNLFVWYSPQIFELTTALLLAMGIWKALWYVVSKVAKHA